MRQRCKLFYLEHKGILYAIHKLHPLMFTNPLICFAHFTDEKTEAHAGEGTWPGT